jgi:phosphonate dehydrogenase
LRPRILVTARIFPETRVAIAELGELIVNDSIEPWPAATLYARAAEADAMIAFMTDHVDAAFLEKAPRLRVIACALKGYDNIDVAACRARGVAVSIVPDVLTAPTAELGIGLLIGLGRHIRAGDAVLRGGGFAGWRPSLYGQGLDGARVCILGLGALGAAIAARLVPFGCTLVGVDPAADAPGVTRLPLDVALDGADAVIAALPLNRSTWRLLGAARLARLPAHALLVNVGRGSTVDEPAVAAALEARRLGGYAADVFAMEDWALPDRPRAVEPGLLAHPCTLFTPHLGSAVARVRRAIELRAVANVADVLQGRAPRDAVG